MKIKTSSRPKLDPVTKASYRKARAGRNLEVEKKKMLAKRAKLVKRFDAGKPVPKEAVSKIKTDRAGYLEGK